jgi:threonine/homoserine/homoserine lactone efflux protein
VLVAVATGITVTLLAVPALRIVVIVFSAAYILRLAYHVATAPPLREAAAGEHAPSFVGGAVLAVVNPKAWVAIAATFASARLADAPAADALVKVTILGGLLIVIMGGWLVTGASIAPPLRDPRRSRRFNLALAIALVVATASAVIH